MRAELREWYRLYQEGVMWLIEATGTRPFFEGIVRWLARHLP